MAHCSYAACDKLAMEKCRQATKTELQRSLAAKSLLAVCASVCLCVCVRVCVCVTVCLSVSVRVCAAALCVALATLGHRLISCVPATVTRCVLMRVCMCVCCLSVCVYSRELSMRVRTKKKW